MCGRYCLDADADAVISTFQLTKNVILKPRYNIAPGQVVPVIRALGQLDFLTWGLRPAWLKADHNAFTNARLETINEKPAFKNALRNRRCLVIATGYFEWRIIGNAKQPYFISFDKKRLLAFAGLWENDTFAIITKPADKSLQDIHERMPLIIAQDNYALWLNHSIDSTDVLHQVQKDEFIFAAHPVSTKVNNTKNDFAECILSL